MATLTWRNVDAPDFRTSLEGYNTFSRLMDNAFRGATEGLNTFDASLDQKANTAVIAAAMRERDPEAYQAALASGQFIENVDPRRISAQTYAALNNQASSLLNQATQTQQLGDMKYASDQVRAFDQLGDEFQQIQSLRRIGTPQSNAEAEKLMASLRPQLANVGTRNTMGFIKGLDDAEMFGIDSAGRRLDQRIALNRDRRDETRLVFEGREQNRADARLNMEQGRYNWEVSDRNDIKTGQAAFIAMQRRSMDRETALSAFNSPEFSHLTPGAKMYALQQLNGSWGNIYSQEQLGAAAGFTPSDSSSTGASGGPFGGDRSGGTRVMGWTPRVNENSDASVNNKIALISRGIGAGADAGLTKDQFLSLDMTALEGKPAGRHNYGNMRNTDGSWKQFNSREEYNAAQRAWLERRWNEGARTIRDAVEGRQVGQRGGSPASIATGLQLRAGQNKVNKTPATNLLAAASSEAGVQDVVFSLREGKFAGTSQQFLKEQLDNIVRRGRTSDGQYTINYPQAGEILKSSLTEKNDNLGITNWLSGNSVRVGKDGWRLNNKKISEEIERARSGKLHGDLVREQDIQSDTQSLFSAYNRLASTRQAYQNALRRLPSQPGLKEELPRLQLQMEAAQMSYNALSGQIENRNAPNREQPASSHQRGKMLFNAPGGLFTLYQNK